MHSTKGEGIFQFQVENVLQEATITLLKGNIITTKMKTQKEVHKTSYLVSLR